MNDIAHRSRTLPAPPLALAAGAAVGAIAGAFADDGATGVAVGVVVGLVGVVAALDDLRERRIPNEAVVAAFCAAAVLAGVVTIAGPRPVVGGAVGGALAAGVPLLVLHLISPAGLGFGDVKLAAALGALLGVVAWSLGLLLLGAASVLALGGVAVRPSWRRSIPFGAFLAGAAVVVLAGAGWMAEAWAL